MINHLVSGNGRLPYIAVLYAVLATTAADASSIDENVAKFPPVQVTATPLPEPSSHVPQSVTVISRDQLINLGASNLRSALALVAGVQIAPGGDGGPAGSVPEFQGLREFDAFLLLVDGVPWGGAFNPDLPSIDLNDVERIEVLRGAEPVKYGATSFVGVINIIHHAAGTPGRHASAAVGSWDSGTLSYSTPLTQEGAVMQSLSADVSRRGFRDPRTEYTRSHILYRSSIDTSTGRLHLDVDALSLQQNPASPHPRADAGAGLSSLVPLDANNNPSDARLDEDRFHVALGYDTRLATFEWSTTLAATYTDNRNIRGFLRTDPLTDTGAANADGFRQSVNRTDVYLDSHLTMGVADNFKMVGGISYLYGSGQQRSENFEYYVPLDGSSAPASSSRPVDERTYLIDRRNFLGVYGQLDWSIARDWDLQIGARANNTIENRGTRFQATGSSAVPDSDRRSETRGSGIVALSYTAWQSGSDNTVFYGNYRNTYKPSAVDFGPEAETDILVPETAQSYGLGAKGKLSGRRIAWSINAFLVNFNNVVIPGETNGLPGLQSGGQQRLQGVELSLAWQFDDAWQWRANYSYHDAYYRNFTEIISGQPVRLDGNRLPMSPHHLFSTGLFYIPEHGWTGHIVWRMAGNRYLDMRNTALTGGYAAVDASIGYRFERWWLRLSGANLTNQRPPVAESELGDRQFYLLPARYIGLSASYRF